MNNLNENRVKSFDAFEITDPDNTKPIVREIWDRIRIDDESILCNPGQLEIFYELARGLHTDRDGWIIEFGTHQGGSAVVFGTGLRDSGSPFTPMITIDVRGLTSM